MHNSSALCKISNNENGEFTISPVGNWKACDTSQAFDKLAGSIAKNSNIKSIKFSTEELSAWDSGLLNFLIKTEELCRNKNINVDRNSLPDGLMKLVNLATAVPARKGAQRSEENISTIENIGVKSKQIYKQSKDIISFIGATFLVFISFLRAKTCMRYADMWKIVEECGPNALPIVTLISMLVGMILAFIGAVQLAQFGAQIYVANLVGIAMLREMGAIMAGIIVSGRTGAAFAAELGTMQVNEEIDALTTFGISPMEFLVLPRMLALMLMMPLLCIYADLMGVLGGALVSIWALDISSALYWDQTIGAITLTDFLFGVCKSVVFGILVAVAGCLRGMQSGRSSAAVGEAATSAVVTAIVLIVITDAIFSIISNVIGL